MIARLTYDRWHTDIHVPPTPDVIIHEGDVYVLDHHHALVEPVKYRRAFVHRVPD